MFKQKANGKIPEAIPAPPGETVDIQETQTVELTHLQTQLIMALLVNVTVGKSSFEVVEQANDLKRKLESLDK